MYGCHMAQSATDTRTVLLDAALAELLAHGVRRTTASDIARRAAVSRQTLYRYWPDVQSLLAELVTRELFAVVPREETAASLPDLVDDMVRTAERIRDLPLVQRLRATDPELFARYVFERLGTSQRGIQRELARRIGTGQADGFVRAGDPDRLAAFVLLIAQSAVQSASLIAEWVSPAQWREELAAALTGYLVPRGDEP
ncbi:TetR/AcrR family transcriptional regulator [Microbacterium lacus]|uniref:TetR/AcrR family transcriptional regulator n=2 Tax=Microbacteriaceae TaxID=85023 RepID=A0ABN2GCD8_9MICO